MSQQYIDKIKDMEEKHRLLADNMIDAIWVLDSKAYKYEYITPSIEKISGYRADELLSIPLKDRLTPDSFIKVMTMLESAKTLYKRGMDKVETLELQLNHKNGSTYWVEIRARFFKEKNGKLKIIGITRDITEKKKNELIHEEMIKRLSDTLAEKEKLLKEVKVLRGLLPICSGCKRIRDEQGKWWPLDIYIARKTDSELTHTICPDCSHIFYGKHK